MYVQYFLRLHISLALKDICQNNVLHYQNRNGSGIRITLKTILIFQNLLKDTILETIAKTIAIGHIKGVTITAKPSNL
ncbi:hypothetical protein K2F43_20100 [Clostridium estertheticum]|uniref:hypothetical protein n=1 Tax=Clostridium estertheticum TaxID=238834 RepID=UPI001C6F22F0|nr:hypothetical protein [Clostridium estertheticum]MBW9173492.1 hypothetical protein [Clostridium estertheticum]